MSRPPVDQAPHRGPPRKAWREWLTANPPRSFLAEQAYDDYHRQWLDILRNNQLPGPRLRRYMLCLLDGTEVTDIQQLEGLSDEELRCDVLLHYRSRDPGVHPRVVPMEMAHTWLLELHNDVESTRAAAVREGRLRELGQQSPSLLCRVPAERLFVEAERVYHGVTRDVCNRFIEMCSTCQALQVRVRRTKLTAAEVAKQRVDALEAVLDGVTQALALPNRQATIELFLPSAKRAAIPRDASAVDAATNYVRALSERLEEIASPIAISLMSPAESSSSSSSLPSSSSSSSASGFRALIQPHDVSLSAGHRGLRFEVKPFLWNRYWDSRFVDLTADEAADLRNLPAPVDLAEEDADPAGSSDRESTSDDEDAEDAL